MEKAEDDVPAEYTSSKGSYKSNVDPNAEDLTLQTNTATLTGDTQ